MQQPKEPTPHELNVLMAEKVMGWKRRKREEVIGRDGFYESPSGMIYNGHFDHEWSPTSNRAQALMVLDECRRHFPIVIYGADGPTCYLHLERAGEVPSEGPTIQEAICRFAAKMFGGEN